MAVSLLLFLSTAASAGVVAICDVECGGTTSPTDSTLLQARSAPAATRGSGSAINPAFHVPKVAAPIGSQSYTYAVPLFSYPGRADMTANLNLYYNSFIWTSTGRSLTLNADFDTPSVGFRLDFGWLAFSDDGSIGVLTDATGAKHTATPMPGEYRTTDGTDIRIVGSNGTATQTALYKSGLRVTYALIDPNGFTLAYRPTLFEDANGNTISIVYQNTRNLAISSVTDSLGRNFNFIYDPSGSLNCVTTASNCTTANNLDPAKGALAQTYTFSWDPNYVLRFAFTISTGNLVSGSTLKVLTAVTRPDGTSVHFDYGDWGIVSTIRELSASNTLRYSTSYNFPPAANGPVSQNPGYTEQTVFDGVNTAKWTYSVTRDATTQAVTSSTVTDPNHLSTTIDLDTSGRPTHMVTSGAACSPTPCVTPHVATQTTWTLDSQRIPRMTEVTNILEDDQTQTTTHYGYDASGNLNDVLVYDFGKPTHGPLLKETVISYITIGGQIVKPQDVQVKDALGHITAHRKFQYDEGTLTTQSPNPAGHDGAFSATARGNLTTTTVYSDAATDGGAIATKYTYDNLGNVLTQQDGCCTYQQLNYSSATQFAYPDAILAGPPGKQIQSETFSFLPVGLLASVTDDSNRTTSVTYDGAGRVLTSKTPDGVVTTTTYDDSGLTPAISTSSSASPLVQRTQLGPFGPLDQTTLNGQSVINEQKTTFDVAGRVLSSSNPFGPNETPLYTTYGYDPLGRIASITPPAVSSAGQNPYLASYSLTSISVKDPALNEHRQFFDALGRTIQVDEPGELGGANATAAATITGTEKSVATSSGNGATSGQASVTITPNTQSDRSTVVKTHSATVASGTITISGTEGATIIDPCADQGGTFGSGGGTFSCPKTIWDVGSVTVTINGISKTASYGRLSTSTTIATDLATQFGSNSVFGVTSSSNVLTVKATVAGAAGNSITMSGGSFGDFSAAPSSSTLTQGTDDVFTTFFDTGNVQVNFTANGTQYSKSVAYGQTDTGSTIAQSLQRAFSSDVTLNSLVIASVNTNALTLTTVATGSGTNYPFSVSSATNSQYFTGGSTSFTTTPSGSNFAPGKDGILYDSGSIKATVTGYTTAPFSESAPFGQGSSAITVANSIAAAFVNDPLSPVDASVAAGTANITFTARRKSTDVNGITITVKEVSNQGASFPTPSYPTVSATLSGGANSTPSIDPSATLSTFYTYDTNGYLIGVAQGPQTRTYHYDSLGRLTSSISPETGNQAVTYTYKDFGGLDQKIDPRVLPGTSTHLTTTYTYDDYDRVKTVTYNDGTPGVTYTYGAPNAANNTGGRLARVEVAPPAPAVGLSARDDYQYDVMGRATQFTTNLQMIGSTLPAGSFNVVNSYHPDGTLASITYPSGRVVTYDDDPIGRLTTVQTNSTPLLTINQYNAANELLNATFGNGVQAAFTFNAQLKLTGIRYATPSTTYLDLTYDYGAPRNDGKIAGITDNVNAAHSTRYTYDALLRLTVAQTTDMAAADGWKLAFSYDRYGNRISQIKLDGNALVANQGAFADARTNHLNGLTYDANGNVTADGSHTYAFDAVDRLKGVDGSSGNYAYGPSGLRVVRNGVYSIYSGNVVIAEYTAGSALNSPQAEYVYANGRLLATLQSGTINYSLPDHLSTRAWVDANGATKRSYGHLPFGATWYESGLASRRDFTTYERDAESGLDYARARYDSTFLGRFMSRDPLPGLTGDPQSLNGYAYVGNDPINMTDPSGMAGGNWLCLLNEHGDCVGGDYNGAGLFATAGLGLWADPFGPMVDPTKWDPLAEGEAAYDKQVKEAFAEERARQAQASDDKAKGVRIADPIKYNGSYGLGAMAMADSGQTPEKTTANCEWSDGTETKCSSVEVIRVEADPDVPHNELKDDAPGTGNQKVHGIPEVYLSAANDPFHCPGCADRFITANNVATSPCTYVALVGAGVADYLTGSSGAAEFLKTELKNLSLKQLAGGAIGVAALKYLHDQASDALSKIGDFAYDLAKSGCPHS